MEIMKRKLGFISVCSLINFFLLFPLTQPVFSNDKMQNTLFIISNGNELVELLIQNGALSTTNNLFVDKKWDSMIWPSYDKKNGLLYFEAKNDDFGWASQIFSKKLCDKKEHPIKVIKGLSPSISPNGSLLVYYQHPNQLWLLEIKSQAKKQIVSNVSNGKPIVWISDKDFLFTDKNEKLIRMDVVSGRVKNTGHQYVIPDALSPDGERVLCGSYDGQKIFIYTIKTNSITTFKKTFFFSMGSSFVWTLDGKQFLYTRQTLLNLIQLNESRSLFLCSLDGKEKKLIDWFALFGGFALVLR
jgi:Tol biopolymer transport system component